MPLEPTSITYQIRVPDFEAGVAFYTALLARDPDFVPHDDFAEWELIDRSWLQLNKGTAAAGSGPLRLGTVDIERERQRVVDELGVEPFEIETRDEVPVLWATFPDPWGNQLGFFQAKPV